MDKTLCPPPTGSSPEYARLWRKAWSLADYIDYGKTPMPDRLARLPELDNLIEQMAAMERQQQ